MSNGVLLEAAQLTRVYAGPSAPLVIFERLDLAVPRGAIVAIIGPSGAGKSTLLHLLGGLDRPTSGHVYFEGEDIFLRSREQLADNRNRKVGFVFQFHHLLPEFTALENAAMPLVVRGVKRTPALERAREWLDRVGLGSRVEHRIGEMSGGEQQRVAIARALVGDAEVLLADEPTGNLDPETGRDVFALIRALHIERGLTAVIVTHNGQIAVQCDQVWRLREGRLEGS
jgi:lipoprotein-releasing system ATP-binding protein